MQTVPETFFTGESQDEKDPDVVEDNAIMSSERFVRVDYNLLIILTRLVGF